MWRQEKVWFYYVYTDFESGGENPAQFWNGDFACGAADAYGVDFSREVYLWTHRSRSCLDLLAPRKQMLWRLDWSTSSATNIVICTADERYNSNFLLLDLQGPPSVPLNILQTLDNSPFVCQPDFFICKLSLCMFFYRIQRELAEIALDPPPNCR